MTVWPEHFISPEKYDPNQQVIWDNVFFDPIIWFARCTAIFRKSARINLWRYVKDTWSSRQVT